jgi:hypothetical protein
MLMHDDPGGEPPKFPQWLKMILVLIGLVILICIIMWPLVGTLLYFFTTPI